MNATEILTAYDALIASQRAHSDWPHQGDSYYSSMSAESERIAFWGRHDADASDAAHAMLRQRRLEAGMPAFMASRP